MDLLDGKVAIVTGGGRGVARGVAIELAKVGADVAIVDIDADNAHKVAAEIEEIGRRSLAIGCDVSKREEVNSAVATTVAELGGLHVLVNMAHYLREGFDKPLVEITDEDFDNLRWYLEEYMELPDGGAVVRAERIDPMRRRVEFALA